MCRIEPGSIIHCPSPIAQELDLLASKVGHGSANQHRLARLECRFTKSGCIVSAGLNQSVVTGNWVGQTVYARIMHWDNLRITNSCVSAEDDTESALLARLERLTLNILFFLSATPFEYEPEIVRKPQVAGQHTIPGLFRAVFVGQSQIRAIQKHRTAPPEIASASTETSTSAAASARHVAAHWRAGAWRRVAYGPRHSLRQLRWIQPYRTSGMDTEPVGEDGF